MTKFRKGDRVLIQEDSWNSPPPQSLRLATICDIVGGMSTSDSGGRIPKSVPLYKVHVPKVYDNDPDEAQEIAEDWLEPAGHLLQKYFQIAGPFGTAQGAVDEAIVLAAKHQVAIDIIASGYPFDWFLVGTIQPGMQGNQVTNERPGQRWFVGLHQLT